MTNSESAMIYGKMQPQALELERLVLGAMMLERNGCVAAISFLRPEMFYHEHHQLIFKAINRLFNNHNPVDIETVTSQLRTDGVIDLVGGAFSIAELTNRVGSAANIEYHCLIIHQKWIARELIRIGSTTIQKGYEDTTDIFELVEDSAKQIISLSQLESTPDTTPSARITKAIKQIQLAKETGNVVTGISSGLYKVDKIIGGWQKQDLIVIAARPGAGKSALAIFFAAQASVENPVLMFSLEMSDTQIAMRELAMANRLKYSRLRKGEVDSIDMKNIMNTGNIEQRNFYVDSSSKLSIAILRSKLMKAIYEKGIKLVVVDYLNLMEGESNNQNTVDKVTEITKQLKRIAKQFDIPIILLAQLNREVEKESDKKPQLHHLKSSGAIEEYSDVVLLLFRPAYYQKEKCETPNLLMIDIAKHKQGSTGGVEIYCEIEHNVFADDSPMDSGKRIIPLKDFSEPIKDTPF